MRGDFLFKLERYAEVQREFERAAELTLNSRERDLLLARADHMHHVGQVERYS